MSQSVVLCPVLTVASWPAYRLLRRHVRWSGIPISCKDGNFPQFAVINTMKSFSIVNEAEVDVFLEFFCFFCDPTDTGNLISSSFAFSKSSLNIWKFTVRTLLKPGLENFEHYFASMWDDCNCVEVWTFFGIAFLWDGNENWPFPVLWKWTHFSPFTMSMLSTPRATQLSRFTEYWVPQPFFMTPPAPPCSSKI